MDTSTTVRAVEMKSLHGRRAVLNSMRGILAHGTVCEVPVVIGGRVAAIKAHLLVPDGKTDPIVLVPGQWLQPEKGGAW